VARRFKANTRLVVVNHASNVIGTVQPVAEIGARCRKRGVALVIDASQTAGKVPIDVEKMHIDVVAFTGHKSLFARPASVGSACATASTSVTREPAAPACVRWSPTTSRSSLPSRVRHGEPARGRGLHAGVNWLLDRDPRTIHQHEMALITALRDGLRAIDGVTLYCQDDLSGHIGVLIFNVAGFEAADVGTLLDVDYEIACRTGLHCAPLLHKQLGTEAIHGAVRLSVGPFNTMAHIETAIGPCARLRGRGGPHRQPRARSQFAGMGTVIVLVRAAFIAEPPTIDGHRALYIGIICLDRNPAHKKFGHSALIQYNS